ncbi:MAG: Rne/Rng family ribonuclease [Elusimicrobia bacterium]|nr:Rne/Rng family ribonuclease [Elusimicrobiota bacterium]
MKREIIVNRSENETRVAILEDSELTDLFIERTESEKIVGNIYKGKVEAILPGLQSSFIDAGLVKNVYLSGDDVLSAGHERKIEKMLSRGKEILVQIDKEPIGTKGAKGNMNISLPGRLLVFMPFEKHIGISKNIESKEETDRLKKMVQEIKGDQPGGFIVRTEAEDASEKEIKREMKYLQRLWVSISQRAEKAKVPSLIHRDLGIVFQTVRDYFNEEIDILLIDSQKEYDEVVDFVKIVSPELLDKVQKHQGKINIFKAYGIEDQIKKLSSSYVNLPSGGYIIIQEAESLCAIDVNTGRFKGKKSQEETVTTTNVEAAQEIARQIRLRNIGGIIVIDFIDMKSARNRQRVLDILKNSVKGDKAKIKIWPITKLGLIEMTRERRRESLFALLGEKCPTCNGLGVVLSKESLFINISNELKHLKVERHAGKVRIRLSPEVAPYFRERLQRLKKIVGSEIDIQSSHDIAWEDYQIIIE